MKTVSLRSLGFSLVLAAVLALGASVLWLFLAGWITSIAMQVFGGRGMNEQLYFTVEGDPLLQSSDYTTNTTVLRTLDGQPVDDVTKIELQYGTGMLGTPDFPFAWQYSMDEAAWDQRVTGFLEMGGAPIFWYFICDESIAHGYFEGFDSKTRSRVGYLGLHGFRSEKPPIKEQITLDPHGFSMWWGRFAGQYGNPGREPHSYGMMRNQPSILFVLGDEKLYRVDFRHRSIDPVVTNDKVLAVGNLNLPVRVPDQQEMITKHRIVLRFANELQVMDDDGAIVRKIPMPGELRDRLVGAVLALDDQAIVVGYADPAHAMTEIYWFDAAGQITRRQTARIGEGFVSYSGQPMWQVAVASPSPLAVSFTALLAPWTAVSAGQFENYPAALAHTLRNGWLWLAAVFALAVVLAIVAYRRQHRLSQPAPELWAMFVLLLGPAGWIGYRFHRNWPATARCWRCGAEAPHDRQQCAACSAEFELPARRGVEILA